MMTVTLLGVLIVSASGDVRRDVIDLMDHYYQAQFADLEMIKEGQFGTSRVETSSIKNHSRKGGDPGYRHDYANEVMIFGNGGKRLNASTIVRRYHRYRNGSRQGQPQVPAAPHQEIDPLIKLAVRESAIGRPGPFVKDANGWLLEARRINLSKKECLSCHKGMKQGEPVGLIVYLVHKR
jgi:hypothetical protein